MKMMTSVKPFSYHVPRRKDFGWTYAHCASIYIVKILLLISIMGLIGAGSQDSSVPNFAAQEYNVDFEEKSSSAERSQLPLPLISASSLALALKDEDKILSQFEPMKMIKSPSANNSMNQTVIVNVLTPSPVPVVPLPSKSQLLPFISSENKSTFSDRSLNLDEENILLKNRKEMNDELIPSEIENNLISSSEEIENPRMEIMRNVKRGHAHAHAKWMNQSLLENQILADEEEDDDDSSSNEQGHYDDSFSNSNEYSSASDRDRKYLSNGKRPRRSVMHLYDMVMCGTGGCNPLLYKGYGCYCGFLGSGIPVDGIDRCCAKHDWCYHHAKCPPLLTYFVPYYWTCNEGRPNCVSDFSGWKGICGAHLCECDRQFAQCLQKYPCPRSRAMCMTSPWRFWQNLVMQPPLHHYG